MRVLFETLFGSSLYGTTMPTSDRDYKRVVLPDLDLILLGKAPKNSVKHKNKKLGEKNGVGDIDSEDIPLYIFARDFLEGQTYAIELCFAVEGVDAEQAIYEGSFSKFCSELREHFLTSNINAMAGYAVNQAKIYSDKGDRLNAARAVKRLYQKFSLSHRIMDHAAEFKKLAEEIENDYPEYFGISEYAVDSTGQTLRPCTKLLTKILPFTNTFSTSLITIDSIISDFGSRAIAASISSSDWKATAHAVRIINEGITLLTTKKLRFPLDKDYANYLRSIIRGEHDIEKIRDEIVSGVDKLQSLADSSALPKLSTELKKDLDVWMLPWLRKYYNLK